MGSSRDRGQAVLLMLVVIVCCGLVAVAVGRLGGDLRIRQQAQTAADAAALAGVEGGRSAASDLAARNGAVLVRFEEMAAPDGSRTVTVTVEVSGISARARATNGP